MAFPRTERAPCIEQTGERDTHCPWALRLKLKSVNTLLPPNRTILCNGGDGDEEGGSSGPEEEAMKRAAKK